MERVLIREVGPRDGLQREAFVDTATKLKIILELAQAGCREIEVTSFVSPKWVPQFADAQELVRAVQDLPQRDKLILSALVPNQKGLDALLEVGGIQELCFFIGVTDTFNEKNVNRSTQAHLEAFLPVLEQAKSQGLQALAYLSVCCGCPYEGEVPIEEVISLSKRLFDAGFGWLSLGDTIGIGTPKQVAELFQGLRQEVPIEKVIFHAHDTYHRGVANVWAAYQEGVRAFDSSIGGLGGCPFVPGARGNVATEDIVDLFHRSDIEPDWIYPHYER